MSGSIKWAPTLCTMCSVILSKERSRKTFILRSTTQTSSEWRTAPWFLLMPTYYTRFPLLSGLMDPPESLQGEGTRLPNSNSAEVFLSTGQPAAQSVCLPAWPACQPISSCSLCVCRGFFPLPAMSAHFLFLYRGLCQAVRASKQPSATACMGLSQRDKRHFLHLLPSQQQEKTETTLHGLSD